MVSHVLAVDPRRPNIVYAGACLVAVHRASLIHRFGESWISIINLGPDLSIVPLSVNPHDGYVHMSSFAGNWRLPPPPWWVGR